MGDGEIFAQMIMQPAQHCFQRIEFHQRNRQPVHLLADFVVVFADADQLMQLDLQLAVFLPQRDHLAFADRNHPALVGMRNPDIREHFGIVIEKLRIIPQVVCNIFRFHHDFLISKNR